MSPNPVILLVEGEENDVWIFQMALGQCEMGVDVQVVSAGEAAIEYLTQASSEQDSELPCPQLVVTDVNMQPGNGFSLIRWIRSSARWRDLPVIVLTGSERPQDRERAEQLGATRFYSKGSVEDVRRILSEVKGWLGVPHTA